MTGQFKEITCDEAHALIESCANTSIDRIQWGRLRQHIRSCTLCLRYMRNFHARRIRKEVEIAVKQDGCSFLYYGPVVYLEYYHISKGNLEIYPDGELTPDEKNIIADHLKICVGCRRAHKEFTQEQKNPTS